MSSSKYSKAILLNIKQLKTARYEPEHILFLLVLVAHFMMTLYFLYNRYQSFAMQEPTDSATYMQASWSILHSSPFTVSIQERIISYFPQNFFGDQLIFILVAFAPLLLISQSGVVFLVIQAATISLGAILLYLISLNYLRKRYLPLLIVAVYLSSPIVYLTYSEFGFRVETLFIPLVFAVFYSMAKGKVLYASLAIILLLATKHNSIPVVVMIGVYFLLLEKKHWRFSLFCIFAAVIYYFIGVEVVMKSLQESPTNHIKHLAGFGNTPVEILVNMFSSPQQVLQFLSETEIKHINKLFFPLGYLAFIHPVSWISSFQLIVNIILGDYNSTYCGWHWAIVAPFIFLGLLYAITRLLGLLNNNKYLVVGIYSVLLLQIFVNLYHFNKDVVKPSNDFFYHNEGVDASEIAQQLEVIEPGASVMVSSTLLWHLYAREKVYVSRMKFHDEVDYIAVLKPLGGRKYENAYLIREIEEHVVNGASKLDQFSLVSDSGHLIILKNKGLQ